jgi:hypothetical protein
LIISKDYPCQKQKQDSSSTLDHLDQQSTAEEIPNTPMVTPMEQETQQFVQNLNE